MVWLAQHATKATPKLVQTISQGPNVRSRLRSDEPATVVYPSTISARTVEQIARQSLLSGPTVILPTPTIVEPPTKARTKVIKEPELPWQVTPAVDLSKLGNHYLMLSKIRLTSKCNSLSFHPNYSLIQFHSMLQPSL